MPGPLIFLVPEKGNYMIHQMFYASSVPAKVVILPEGNHSSKTIRLL